jgi:hypothetical protein
MNGLTRIPTCRGIAAKTRVAAVALLILAAIAWAGDTPWKTKPYQQWDDKDIHQILFDSPWARSADVTASWRTPGSAAAPNLPSTASPVPESGGGGMGRGGGGSTGASPATIPAPAPPDAGSSLSGQYPTVKYSVDWISSKTMRAALAQRDVLHAGKSPAEAEKYVDQPQSEYAIVIEGTDMSPFLRADEKFFQANSFLQLKKAGFKVSPERVEFRRDTSSDAVLAAIFFFAKKSPGGSDLILPSEKSIEFTCKLGSSRLKVNFEPQKMAAQSGPDF